MRKPQKRQRVFHGFLTRQNLKRYRLCKKIPPAQKIPPEQYTKWDSDSLVSYDDGRREKATFALLYRINQQFLDATF